MKNETEECVSFGDEWVKEVSKFSKPELIKMYRDASIKKIDAENKYRYLSEKYNDLLFFNND